jgi:high-affinity nickel permease
MTHIFPLAVADLTGQPAPATLAATLGLGFILGLKHAIEADHVVAVSAIVTEHKSIWKSALVGAMWGIGHTLALLVAGLALLLMRSRIPEHVEHALETAVALTIVVLGVGVLLRLFRGKTIHAHAHEHDGHAHLHLHTHDHGAEHIHAHQHALPWRGKAVFVGVIHGLAGSGALTVLVMQQLPTVITGLVYILVFGVGTIGGMLLMSGLVSVPIAAAAGRYDKLHGLICTLAGLGSVVFGIYYAYSAWA